MNLRKMQKGSKFGDKKMLGFERDGCRKAWDPGFLTEMGAIGCSFLPMIHPQIAVFQLWDGSPLGNLTSTKQACMLCSLKIQTLIILWMEEILHQLVHGLSPDNLPYLQCFIGT